MKYGQSDNLPSGASVTGFARDYDKGRVVEPHSHDASQIIHASDGVMRVFSAGSNWVIPPGRGLWVPAGVVHGFHCLTVVSTRTVYLSGAPENLPQTCEVWKISGLMREVIIRISLGASKKDLPHLMALMLSEVERADVLPLQLSQPADRRLSQIATAIVDDPSNRTTLESWSRQVGASTRTLNRLFLSETGLTFRQWRRQARLIAALEQLATGEPVTRVAFAVGYDNPSAFIEMFRENLGTTPGQFFLSRD